jgi:hypothetical protein
MRIGEGRHSRSLAAPASTLMPYNRAAFPSGIFRLPSRADQERGSPFGDHNRRQMSIGARDYRHDGRVYHEEVIDADEPAARIDDCCRVVW